ERFLQSQMPKGCDKSDLKLWKNSMHRDFTVNSLFFDPVNFKIYDYNNAMKDLLDLKLRTLVPAHLSFTEDCARILRGLRIAARLGLSFSKDIEAAIHRQASSLLN
nr:polynucleotide adenylyltransferase family protein [Tanacetum cinerariifolium]